MRSNKPAAEEFQDWVFGEVLPTIRKTGKYEVAPALGLSPSSGRLSNWRNRLLKPGSSPRRPRRQPSRRRQMPLRRMPMPSGPSKPSPS